jgi:hypothetical protein
LAFTFALEGFIVKAWGPHDFRNAIGFNQENPKENFLSDKIRGFIKLLFKATAARNLGARVHPIQILLQSEVIGKKYLKTHLVALSSKLLQIHGLDYIGLAHSLLREHRPLPCAGKSVRFLNLSIRRAMVAHVALKSWNRIAGRPKVIKNDLSSRACSPLSHLSILGRAKFVWG